MRVREAAVEEAGRLNRLLWACNQAVAEFGFGGLYDGMGEGEGEDQGQGEVDRSDFFHFSLAWCLTSQVEGKEVSQDVLDEVWSSTVADEARNLTIPIDAVLMKIGNVVHRIPLSGGQRKVAGKSGILG